MARTVQSRLSAFSFGTIGCGSAIGASSADGTGGGCDGCCQDEEAVSSFHDLFLKVIRVKHDKCKNDTICQLLVYFQKTCLKNLNLSANKIFENSPIPHLKCSMKHRFLPLM